MNPPSILDTFLTYSPCPTINQPKREQDLDGWALTREQGDFILTDPNGYFYSCFFNYQVPGVKALAAPLRLRRRLGHLDPSELAATSLDKLAASISGDGHCSSLHRFPNNVSKRIVEASKKLVEEYKGDSRNIWPHGTHAADVIKRMRAFKGVGQKIANMTAILLVKAFGIHLTHWEDIDVAVDRHVARVFLRTGIVHCNPGWHSVSDVAPLVIQAARTLLPVFPGHLDVAFVIGQEWCTAKKAYCDYEASPCPLRSCCQRRTDVHVV